MQKHASGCCWDLHDGWEPSSSQIRASAMGCNAGCPASLHIPFLSSIPSCPCPAHPGHLSPFPPARVHPCGISHRLASAHPRHMHEAAGLAVGCDGPGRWDARWDGSREPGPAVGAGWGGPGWSHCPHSSTPSPGQAALGQAGDRCFLT